MSDTKEFHISDVLSMTTGRLVGSRHMDGVYEISQFMTGESIFTHQLPRVGREIEPTLAAQYPRLMKDHETMQRSLQVLDRELHERHTSGKSAADICAWWVETIRQAEGLPEMIPLRKMSAQDHLHIDPIEEAKAMMGDDNVIVL